MAGFPLPFAHAPLYSLIYASLLLPLQYVNYCCGRKAKVNDENYAKNDDDDGGDDDYDVDDDDDDDYHLMWAAACHAWKS